MMKKIVALVSSPGRSVAGGPGCRVMGWGGVGVVGDGPWGRARSRVTCRLETGGQDGGGRAAIGSGLCDQKLRPLHPAAAPRLPEVAVPVVPLAAGVQVWRGREGSAAGWRRAC